MMKTPLIACIILFLFAVCTATAQFQVSRHVIACGATSQGSAQYRLSGTVGQTVIDEARNSVNRCYAGFWYTVNRLVVSALDEREAVPGDLRIGSVFPHPMRASSVIAYAVAEPGPVQMVLYDVFGAEVARLFARDHTAGRHALSFHAGHYAPGVYVLELRSRRDVQRRRIVILR